MDIQMKVGYWGLENAVNFPDFILTDNLPSNIGKNSGFESNKQYFVAFLFTFKEISGSVNTKAIYYIIGFNL